MQNRRTNSKNRRPTSRSKNKGKNNRNNKRSILNCCRALLLMVIAVIIIVAARNDFDVHDTIADFRNFTFLDLLTGDSRTAITFSDDFHEKADYLALLYPEGRETAYLDVMTIQAEDWESERLDIGGHDHLDRTLPIIAYLSERNLGTSAERGRQTHYPTGWQQNQFEIDGSGVWIKNRGHLIAYTLTFNFNEDGEFVYGYSGSDDDPANLFTQTAHSNQNIMTNYEAQIRSTLADGGEVVFKAAPIFRDDELMARGIWLQAVSTCGDLMLSVFIFNEQPGVAIDHGTGENWLD